MTDATATNRPSARSATTPIVVLIAGLLVIGLLIVSGGEQNHMRSATGFQGLVSWLKANDIEARTFNGGGSLVRGQIGLRVLPLMDTDLASDRTIPTTREEIIAQTSERDLPTRVVQRKVSTLPTLVILPKWRTGMRKLGAAHKDLLIPELELNRLLRQLGVDAKISRDPGGWRTTTVGTASLGLHHGQTISGNACTPIIGTSALIFVAECPGPSEVADEEATFWLLTDPDLANNHGLQWADNAANMLEIVGLFDTSKPVITDLTDRVYIVDRDWQAERRDRTWEEFARMFAWPFSMIWIAFGVLAALGFWRAIIRDGPVASAFTNEPRASKETSINARARLLRLADHDAALLATHISMRLDHLAAEILGPHRAQDLSAQDALMSFLSRRNPTLSQELADASAAATLANLSKADILRHLDTFERCCHQVRHEFGRFERAR